jgi:CheY-like chemotaxis protein
MAKILYLEDEAWQVQSTVTTFMERELGHTVKLVLSVEDARRALSTETYDIVFLDIMLDPNRAPIEYEHSGFYLLALIQGGEFEQVGNPSGLPVVIASGVWDATMRTPDGTVSTVEDRAAQFGIPSERFLRKPFLVDEVREVIELALEED